jgi:transcriptional regulator with XRE-family HTH domain
MIIGDRLRALREEKNLSLGNIEKRTGLIRCYVSRVENNQTGSRYRRTDRYRGR